MDRKILDILVCPGCQGKLVYRREDETLICRFDKLAFPIRDNIPVMLLDEAKKISSDDIEKLQSL